MRGFLDVDASTVRLADQPEDWTEPGAHPVLDGVWRIPLPLPSAGLRAVNVYVVRGSDGITLVDAGWADDAGRRGLLDGLAALGHGPDDIARVVVTHAHHDHYTQAIDLHRRYGTEVLLGRGERPSVDALENDTPPPQPEMVRRAGAPELADAMAAFERDVRAAVGAYTASWGRPDRWLDDDERVALGTHEATVMATPGHTRGHVVLRAFDLGALFAGDHVLPHITPSIGYERVPEPAPLRSYLDSLRLVRGQPDTVLLPAHGAVTASTHTRVDELLVHHEVRLEACVRALRAGATTAYEVADTMPWTRREVPLSRLETEHAALAVLEIGAHLEVLVGQGLAVREERGGVTHYAPA